MLEITGDLFNQPDADAICITTNGATRRDGSCVMGRGCALEATKIFPGIDKTLGSLIKQRGNHVLPIILNPTGLSVISFPVKHHWKDDANIDLILRSAHELSVLIDLLEYKHVVIPRPGCGNGRLSWDKVKPVLEKILDDRFHVITWSE